MKTIQIPMNSNPFTVVINNSVYQYKAGQTMEVPDEVAAAIEDALALVPKPKRYLSRLTQLVEGSIEDITADDFEGITKIKVSAFYNCKEIKKAAIPGNIDTIESFAFYGCEKMESVTLGDGLAKVFPSVFDGCTNLTSVFLPKTPPTLMNVNTFANINASCVFYCKDQASMEAYKAAPYWSTLAGTYSFVVES
jgi:hypothetical protein